MHLEGEIASINLIDRLIDMWRQQFTGALRFENDGIIKIIYFKGGDVLSASTNDRADSVDEMLMRAGKVTKEHVKQALTKRKENETLGDALLNLGFITRKELAWGRRVQVIHVIRSVSEWTAGTYTIVADYLPKREEGTIFPLPQLIVEMTVTETERQKFERALESGGVVFEKTPLFDQTFSRLGLNEDADAISSQIDGFRTAAEVAAASKQDTFNAYKLLHALSLLGLIQRPQTGYGVISSPADLSFESDGVADAADAWGSAPQFELDDEPPPAAIPDFSAPANNASPSGFVVTSEIAPTIEMKSPVIPPPAAVSLPPLVTSLPPLDLDRNRVEVPEWGFDEAQIDAARKATESRPLPASIRTPQSQSSREPMRRAQPKPKRSYGFLVTLMVLFILAGLGYFGYQWWIGREPVTVTNPLPPRVVTSPSTTTTTTTESVPSATIVESAPPPATTTAPALTTSTTATIAPPPRPQVVTPRGTPPPPAATGDATRDRYDAMAREFAANPRANFAVQVAIVCDPANVQKALRNSDAVWFIPISLKGRSCYRMFWGRYETRSAAEKGMSSLPASLREGTPAVVTVPQ
ncbi:MAG: hypothetical protein JJE51_05150 [Thermoanaerobaculia bacterium]|nr:hypothetical protein [Thermoanaerobaculia bacterium]